MVYAPFRPRPRPVGLDLQQIAEGVERVTHGLKVVQRRLAAREADPAAPAPDAPDLRHQFVRRETSPAPESPYRRSRRRGCTRPGAQTPSPARSAGLRLAANRRLPRAATAPSWRRPMASRVAPTGSGVAPRYGFRSISVVMALLYRGRPNFSARPVSYGETMQTSRKRPNPWTKGEKYLLGSIILTVLLVGALTIRIWQWNINPAINVPTPRCRTPTPLITIRLPRMAFWMISRSSTPNKTTRNRHRLVGSGLSTARV